VYSRHNLVGLVRRSAATWNCSTEWAKKVSCCIADCNFVNYDQFKDIPLLESLLNFQKDVCSICHISSKYVETLPCKMANNDKVIMH